MKRAFIFLLISGIVNHIFAQNGNTLKNGPIEIQLNEEAVTSIWARGKTNEVEDDLTDGNIIKLPKLV